MRIDRKPDHKEFTHVYHNRDLHGILRLVNDTRRYDQYREEWKRASSLECVPDYPLQLDFELNHSCNFSCPMCTWSIDVSTNKGKENWFNFEIFKEIIDDGVKKGLKAVRFNYINEPLIRRDLTEFIRYSKQAGILDTYFSTNGSLLSPQMSEALIDSGLDRLQVSLDAFTQDTFKKIRIGGNLEKIIQNIETFRNIRERKKSLTPLLRVNFVKTADNSHELENFKEYWKERADAIGIQNLINIVDKEVQEKAELTDNVQEMPRFNCAQPFCHITIRYNGDLLPCCSFYGAEISVDRLWIPNLLEEAKIPKQTSLKDQVRPISQSIQETWLGPKMQFFREIHRKGKYWRNPVCKKCVLSSSHETV
ncbi:MAG: hypothetical protein A2Y81_00965 [Nitrospirae bacterium RBG_13_43_8]|nr:MAG: hypothetical protein A2Y81_00965 [Nitrospirae bacterium RBG_13_43_8]